MGNVRSAAAVMVVALLPDTVSAQARDSALQIQSTAPNVVVIVVDDLRWDEAGFAGHPYLETPNIDRLAREGASFTHAFHAVPLCSPNRASILTGQFPSRHGIIDNVSRSLASHRLETFPQALQAAGYETAFIGKWHMGNDPTPRPGFDYWVGLPGQGRSVDPELYEDGRLSTVNGYTTDILTDRALKFIERDRQGPFFVYLGHKAIHPDVVQLEDGTIDANVRGRYIAAPRHAGHYRDSIFPLRPNATAVPENLIDQPALYRALELKHSEQMTREFARVMFDYTTTQDIIRDRSEMLLAIDEGLGRIFDALADLELLDSTAIIFTSDNGYWYGEHGLANERRLPYDEAVRMPLLIRYPELVDGGERFENLVSSVDIAPTVLDLAGVPIGEHIQGRSVVPLLRGSVEDWRDTVFIEFTSHENPMPWLVDMDYRAVRSAQYKYIHWLKFPADDELYDLAADPYEITNLAKHPAYRNVLVEMRIRLQQNVVRALELSPTRP